MESKPFSSTVKEAVGKRLCYQPTQLGRLLHRKLKAGTKFLVDLGIFLRMPAIEEQTDFFAIGVKRSWYIFQWVGYTQANLQRAVFLERKPLRSAIVNRLTQLQAHYEKTDEWAKANGWLSDLPYLAPQPIA